MGQKCKGNCGCDRHREKKTNKMSKTKKHKTNRRKNCRERNHERQITNKNAKNVCKRSVDKRQRSTVLQNQRALLLKNGTTMRRGTERGREKLREPPKTAL